MKTHYLFSRNKKIGSRIISWGSSYFTKGLEKTPSHVAILLDETFVIESTMTTGVRVVPYLQWKKINEELYKIPCSQIDRPIEEIQELLFEMWGKKYDMLGLLYFTWRIMKLMLFKETLPSTNKWEREDYFFCTEFAGRLAGMNYSMTSPAMMLESLISLANKVKQE